MMMKKKHKKAHVLFKSTPYKACSYLCYPVTSRAAHLMFSLEDGFKLHVQQVPLTTRKVIE